MAGMKREVERLAGLVEDRLASEGFVVGTQSEEAVAFVAEYTAVEVGVPANVIQTVSRMVAEDLVAAR